MSTHNICFRGDKRKISILFGWKKSILSKAMYDKKPYFVVIH